MYSEFQFDLETDLEAEHSLTEYTAGNISLFYHKTSEGWPLMVKKTAYMYYRNNLNNNNKNI